MKRYGSVGKVHKVFMALMARGNTAFSVGRKRDNELCCPTVLMVLMCCVGVTSSADLWDDIQRIIVPSFIESLSALI